MLEVGILKTFDGTDYRAAVQLAGSVTTYFDDLPVDRGIPASQLLPGRSVLVAAPGGNPRDACVLAVWERASGGSGGDHCAAVLAWLGV